MGGWGGGGGREGDADRQTERLTVDWTKYFSVLYCPLQEIQCSVHWKSNNYELDIYISYNQCTHFSSDVSSLFIRVDLSTTVSWPAVCEGKWLTVILQERRLQYNWTRLKTIILTKVFMRHKILSVENILSLYTHTHTGTYTRAYWLCQT